LDLGKYALIEGGDQDANFSYIEETTGNNLRLPIFYFGVELGEFNRNKALTLQTPSEDPITMGGHQMGGMFLVNGGIVDKVEYTKYSPPESANVNYYEFSSNLLNEDDVLGASAYYYKNNASNSTGFTNAANNLIQSTRISQKEPFFSSTITVPNIDLAGTVPISLGSGLLGINITVGSDGVQTIYRFGNEKMKIRNTDIFFKYYYDSARKRQEKQEISSIVIRKGAAKRVY
jgi:hypothetical protein